MASLYWINPLVSCTNIHCQSCLMSQHHVRNFFEVLISYFENEAGFMASLLWCLTQETVQWHVSEKYRLQSNQPINIDEYWMNIRMRFQSFKFNDIATGTQPISQRFYKLLFQILQNPSCYRVENNVKSRSQFCIWSDSSAGVAYANLQPDWICRIIFKAKRIFTRFQLWAHKLLVK